MFCDDIFGDSPAGVRKLVVLFILIFPIDSLTLP